MNMHEQQRQLIRTWMDLYGDSVLRTVRVIVGDPEASEDIAQEVFLRAWRKLDQYRGESNPRTWLYRIAVNLAKNHLRKNRELLLEPDRMEIVSGPWRGPDPESAAIISSQRLQIREAIAALEPGLRLVVALYYLNELSVDEVARVLQVPTGTVKSRLARARARIKPYMEPDGSTTQGGTAYE